MALLRCKMCGGDLEIQENETICVCEFCGTKQTVPKADNDKKILLFGRANKLRSVCEFDKAYAIYESLADEFKNEAEAYWGLVLCKYGIEYVDDPKTGNKIPTCHRSSFDSVLEDENYLSAIRESDPVAKDVYKSEAEYIETLRRGILEISSKEEPYDIFICYKETGKDGQRTHDSVLAQDIYTELTEKGYRVFFSRITLEDKLGVKYEPYIFSALHSSKVMLVVGTDADYLSAVWVKNEWSRYLKLIEAGEKKTLIPCYKGIDPYDLPEEFADLQAQDMGKIGAMQDLVRGIGKLVPLGQAPVTAPANNVENLLQRAKIALDGGDFKKAEEVFEKVLEADVKCADAYLGIDMASKEAITIGELAESYIYTKKEYSANLKEAMRLTPNAPWVAEFNEARIKAEEAKRKAEEEARIKAEEEAEIKAEKERIEKNFSILNGKLLYYRGYNTEVVIPNSVTSIDDSAFKCCTRLTSITIPDSVTSIGESTFEDCTSLTSIKIPNSVTSIGKNAFKECTSLKSITIPNSVTNIGIRAFANCKSLTSITIPNSVTSIGESAFCGCTSLTSVTIPDSVTSIGDSAFQWCIVTSITIPNSVTSIGESAFYGCKNLTSITIPNSVTSIGKEAFDGCTGLTSVTIPNSATSIGESAFRGCTGLTSITIPNSVTSIGDWAFDGCTSLTSVTIPNSVTSIGQYAFKGCTSLTSITIPNSVTSIGEWAFYGCKFITERKNNKVCEYCGGKFKGLFTKTCSGCGREKKHIY